MAAAVADYRPDSVADGKIKKEKQGDTLDLHLVKNPDILRSSRRHGARTRSSSASPRRPRPTGTPCSSSGRAKAERKGVDYLVVNRVGWSEGFATDRNAVIVLDAPGDIVAEAEGSKASVADRILDVVR